MRLVSFVGLVRNCAQLSVLSSVATARRQFSHLLSTSCSQLLPFPSTRVWVPSRWQQMEMSGCSVLGTLHVKCRDTSSPYLHTTDVFRVFVPDESVSWASSLCSYNPVDYTSPAVVGKPWADPDVSQAGFSSIKWNVMDGKIDRRSHVSKYEIVDGRPRNPMGRTGLIGRGTLGKWGPNHAADPIVTRWKRTDHGQKVVDGVSGRSVLQFVAILRKDVRQWAIPGGMVDAGELVSATLKREFNEEAFNALHMSPDQRDRLEEAVSTLFNGGREIYKGYVDDPRNTDNVWMETVAVNFHDDDQSSVGRMDLQAGSDAVGVQWMDVCKDLPLYASHSCFLQTVAKIHNAHW